MANPFKFTTIAHAARAFLGPYDASAFAELGEATTSFVLDIGCGKGAGLQVLGGRGIGIEHNPTFAADARRLNPEAEIWEEDAKSCLDRLPQAPDLILCLGASQAIGTREEAIERLAKLLPPGGHFLFGDGYWRQKPSADYLAFLGAEESEMTTFEQACSAGLPFGLECVAARESSSEDWAAYEDSYYGSMMSWCDSNPADPDAEAFRARITAWREAYLRWGRDTLGFGMYLFRR